MKTSFDAEAGVSNVSELGVERSVPASGQVVPI